MPSLADLHPSLADLHPYQHKAIEFILQRPYCALFVGLGLGKTVITLTALKRLIESKEAKRILVIAPLRVANSVWKQEAGKWTHTSKLRVSICTGTEAQRLSGLRAKAEVYVINRENIPWLVKHCNKKWPFDTVIIDESSSFKNSKAVRWKALRRARPAIKRMVQLTGTPASNGLTDLWAQIYLLDLGERLGKSKTYYYARYFTSDFMGYSWTPKEGSDKKIQSLLSDIVLSLQSEDYLNLPDRIDSVVPVQVPGPVLKQYKELEKEFVLAIGDTEIEALSAAALANKLLQFSNGAIYDEDGNYTVMHDAKVDALKEIIDDNKGEPILVAYNFKSDLARIKKALPDAVVLGKSDKTIEDWNAGKIEILLVHPASAGHGLNLQKGGSLLVWFGLTWSLENYQQLCGRLHRQGQEKPVRVVHLVSEKMIDARVLNAVNNKAKTQSELLRALREGYYGT